MPITPARNIWPTFSENVCRGSLRLGEGKIEKRARRKRRRRSGLSYVRVAGFTSLCLTDKRLGDKLETIPHDLRHDFSVSGDGRFRRRTVSAVLLSVFGGCLPYSARVDRVFE